MIALIENWISRSRHFVAAVLQSAVDWLWSQNDSKICVSINISWSIVYYNLDRRSCINPQFSSPGPWPQIWGSSPYHLPSGRFLFKRHTKVKCDEFVAFAHKRLSMNGSKRNDCSMASLPNLPAKLAPQIYWRNAKSGNWWTSYFIDASDWHWSNWAAAVWYR